MRILEAMSKPVPTRFSEEELAVLDELVAHGVGDSRSAVIRHAVQRLDDATFTERKRQQLLAETDRYLAEVYEEIGEPSTEEMARAEARVREMFPDAPLGDAATAAK